MQKHLTYIKPSRARYETLLGNNTWIFYTRASRHMMSNLNFLKQIGNISPILVELPNGVFRVAKLHGSKNLGSNIKLSNVLCISNFHCNLLSIAKVSRELHCIVIFTNEYCVIQALISRNLIGVVKWRRGVCCFNELATMKVQDNAIASHTYGIAVLGTRKSSSLCFPKI